MQILLFKNYSLISKVISFFSRGKYNHAAIRLSDGTIYESGPKHGVRKISNINDLKGKFIIDFFELDKKIEGKQEIKIKNFLDKQLGKKYDYWMVLGFILFTTRESRKSSKRFFCSELVLCALEETEIYLFKTEPWKITPEDMSYCPFLSKVGSIKVDK